MKKDLGQEVKKKVSKGKMLIYNGASRRHGYNTSRLVQRHPRPVPEGPFKGAMLALPGV